ncbi:MAG: hypothetical protein FWB99_08350 [Treponema sp.]|nr:hypothetical protein [Treponema sp.]
MMQLNPVRQETVIKARIVYGLLSVLLLIMGICVYLFFRDLTRIIFFAWVPLPEFLKPALAELPPSIFSSIVMHNTAGMLWFVSGIMFLRFVWFYRAKEQKVYIGCFCAAAAIMEIAQLSEKVPGTFDVLDLLFMGIGAFVEGLLYNFYVKRRIA